jgi:hypothetical protein
MYKYFITKIINEIYYPSGADVILDQKKDEIINKLESDLKTLETKNLELKYTNRNLISTLSEQKEMLKTLKSKISELESSKGNKHAFEKLNKDHEILLDDYKKLQIQYNKSQDEIARLKVLIPKDKADNGLLSRFLKRKSLDNDKPIEDESKK